MCTAQQGIREVPWFEGGPGRCTKSGAAPAGARVHDWCVGGVILVRVLACPVTAPPSAVPLGAAVDALGAQRPQITETRCAAASSVGEAMGAGGVGGGLGTGWRRGDARRWRVSGQRATSGSAGLRATKAASAGTSGMVVVLRSHQRPPANIPKAGRTASTETYAAAAPLVAAKPLPMFALMARSASMSARPERRSGSSTWPWPNEVKLDRPEFWTAAAPALRA